MASRPTRTRPTRRTGDQTRQQILDAAERLFARFTPSEVGLQRVAAEAGVSHALITHYFQTYDGMVRATLDRRLDFARQHAVQRFLEAGAIGSEFPLLEALLDLCDDGVTVRLLAWSVLTSDDTGRERLATGGNGLHFVVDAVLAKLKSLRIHIPRGEVEFSVFATVSMVLGMTLFGPSVSQAMHAPEMLRNRKQLTQRCGAMLRGYLGQSAVPATPASD